MKETLEMLQTILLGYEENILFEELLHEYKKTLKPNLLAYAFIKYYKTICNVAERYKMLNKDDCASFCLQELDACMLNYSFNKKCSFITYFVTCFANRLRMETEQLLTDIRYSNYITEDIDNCLNLCDTTNNFDAYDYINNNLTKQEIEHCKLLYLGYTNKELSNMFKVSVQYIYTINKRIGKKLLNLV